jgi:hypothetical protein
MEARTLCQLDDDLHGLVSDSERYLLSKGNSICEDFWLQLLCRDERRAINLPIQAKWGNLVDLTIPSGPKLPVIELGISLWRNPVHHKYVWSWVLTVSDRPAVNIENIEVKKS